MPGRFLPSRTLRDMSRSVRDGKKGRFKAAVSFLAATGVVLVCLSYRENEPNHSPPSLKNGDFFAGLQPSEDDIDSPNGQRGFTLLQKAAVSSLLQYVHTRAGAKEKQSSQQIEAGGQKSRTQNQHEEFLSAGAARNQMSDYWQALAHTTRIENGGDQQDAQAAKLLKAQTKTSKGPLTAGEARSQLNEFWSDLGSHDHVKSVRDALARRKIQAAARLTSKAAKATDPVKDTSMDEMERIWSSESGKTRKANTQQKAMAKRAASKFVHLSAQDSGTASIDTDGSKARYTRLPQCDHCSVQHMTWPAWNHRVDHALRVAENIAQGSHWNKTLHHVTLASDDSDAGATHDDSAVAATGTDDADLELEVKSAMASLRAAIAESKAEQVMEESQEHGDNGAGLSSAKRTQCLSICYSEVQSLVGYLAPHQHATAAPFRAPVPLTATIPTAVVAPGPKQVLRAAPATAEEKPSHVSSARADSTSNAGDGDSIEKAVDAVEEAVGDSEEAAGKSGGNGVAAAVGAVAQAVVNDVDAPAAAAAHMPALSTYRGGHAAADVAVAKSRPRVAGVTSNPKPVEGALAKGAKSTVVQVPAARDTRDSTPHSDEAGIRQLEDSALNDAAEAQEQVRQGESELKHLKTLLATAHKLHSHAMSDADSDSDISDVSSISSTSSSVSSAPVATSEAATVHSHPAGAHSSSAYPSSA